MNNTNIEVLGDFAFGAIAIRLYAPSPEDLLEFLPDARPEQSVENWLSFSEGKNWADEASGVRYVGNFIHEFSHLLQHTTLLGPMGRISSIHQSTMLLVSFLARLREDGHWPPCLPLIPWLEKIGGEEARSVIRHLIGEDALLRLYLGDTEFAKQFACTVGQTTESLFSDPFVPTIGHLTEGTASSIRVPLEIPITTTMLSESYATSWEYRYIGSFFGKDIADALVLGGGKNALRVNYDILPLIAMADDLFLALPLLIDWAMDGSALASTDGSTSTDHRSVQPGWRFVRLYHAMRRICKGLGRTELRSALMSPSALRCQVYGLAGLPPDNQQNTVNWVEQLPESPFKSVLRINAEGRANNEIAYDCLEANLSAIQSWTCTPLVLFRNHLHHGYHPGVRLTAR